MVGGRSLQGGGRKRGNGVEGQQLAELKKITGMPLLRSVGGIHKKIGEFWQYRIMNCNR